MSNEPSEFSESGNPIYRYNEREKPFEPVSGDPQHIGLISGHIEKHLGAVSHVFHEIVSDLIHVDLHIVPPRPDREFYTVVTSGMSARAMKVPEGAEDFSYAELMLCLPPDWPLKQADFEDENNYWPLRLLKVLARFPHEYDTWLGPGHTMPNGDPHEPYAANTQLCCAMLTPPLTAPEEFAAFQAGPEITINFMAVIPLYEEEMELKLKKGSDALFAKMDGAEVSELLEVNRKNVAKKRFGLF